MGAGRPKSKIWLVMLAGGKKNVASGNLSCRAWRSLPHVKLGTTLAGPKRVEDVAVGIGNYRTIGEAEIDAAIRDVDVVED